MILVLAGNNREYAEWLQHHNLGRAEATYVALPEHYIGLENCDFVLIGEYYRNPAFRSGGFEAYAMTHGFVHRASLSDAPDDFGT